MKTRLGAAAGALLMLATGTLAAVAAPAVGALQHAPQSSNADLATSYRYSDSGAGHVWGWIVLRNRCDHSCRTGGFGGISYVGDRTRPTACGCTCPTPPGPSTSRTRLPGASTRASTGSRTSPTGAP